MRLVLLTPVAVILLFAGIYLLTPQAALDFKPPRDGYLDAHAHIAGIGAGDSSCFINPELADSFKFDIYLRAFGVTREELEREGDELVARRINQLIEQSSYVGKAVVLALDGVIRNGGIDRSETQIYVPNEFVARMARKYRNLEFGASVHPDRPDWRERLIEAEHNGAVLVKWLPAIMDIDPSDPRYIPYYRTLVELELPLLVHVGFERAFGDAKDALGDPRKLTLALEQGVTVIAAHVATTGEYEGQPSHRRLLSMLQEHSKLYTDISSLTQVNKVGYLVEALDTPGARERMLYGSDWPLQFFPVVSPFFHWPDVDLPRAKTIQNIDNKLDRDVQLKRALGVPASVFERSGELLLR